MGEGENAAVADMAVVGVRSRFSVRVSDVTFSCGRDEHVLRAMIAAGKSPLAVGCRSGGCGVCRVQVTAGTYLSAPMSRARVSPTEEREGIVLACRIFPRSDLVLEPRPWKPNVAVETGLAA